jgi:hypothetical protein
MTLVGIPELKGDAYLDCGKQNTGIPPRRCEGMLLAAVTGAGYFPWVMNPIVLLLMAAALAGCASRQAMQHDRLQPRMGPQSIHHGNEPYRVIDITRSDSLRFFRVIRPVVCNQYVYTELPIYDADTVRHNHSRMWTTRNAIEKCAEVFADLFDAKDAQTEGADAIFYEPATFQVTTKPEPGTRPENAQRGDKLGTTPLFSGSTSLLVASTGAYLKGWAIAWVDHPSEEDLRQAIRRYWDPVHRPPPGPEVYWDRDISRIARRQYEAALYWLHQNGHTQTWDWLADVRKVIPVGRDDGEVDKTVATGTNLASIPAINLLAAHGADRFQDLWMGILRAGKKAGYVVNGANLVAAGNIIACLPSQAVMGELQKMHPGQRQNNSAWDLVMRRIYSTHRQENNGTMAYECPYKPTSFIAYG